MDTKKDLLNCVELLDELGIKEVISINISFGEKSIHLFEFEDLGGEGVIIYEIDEEQEYEVKAFKVIRDIEVFCLLKKEEYEEKAAKI